MVYVLWLSNNSRFLPMRREIQSQRRATMLPVWVLAGAPRALAANLRTQISSSTVGPFL